MPRRSNDEQQFRHLANAIPNLAWIAEADGYIYWYNERWYEYTGTTPEQMKGWGWQAVHDPALLPSVLKRWRISIETGNPFEMIFPLRGRDGKFRSFLTRVVPVRNSSGAVTRWFGTNTDIDELRKTQEALLESEAKLRQHQEWLRLTRTAAKIAPWEFDVEEERYNWSEEVYAMFGGMPLGPSQQDFLSIMKYSNDRDNAVRALKSAITRKRDYEFTFRLVRPDGQIRLIASRGRPFYNQGRDLVLGMFIDVTPADEIKVRPRRTSARSTKRRRSKSK